jgi:hypothetical protein
MAEQEKADQRPRCKFKVTETIKDGGQRERECGSEDRVFNVTGRGKLSGMPKSTPVCAKHLEEAWRKWDVEGAEPCLPERRS